MESMTGIILLCTAVPLAILSLVLSRNARTVCLFLVAGSVVAAIAVVADNWLMSTLPKSPYYITTNLTPLLEEILKAIPPLIYAFLAKPDRRTMLSVAMATGVGFALIENSYVLMGNIGTVTILWAILRVFGASLMHGLTTGIVGLGLSYVRTRKKMFYTGTFALLLIASVYHAIFNSLIQSHLFLLGTGLSILTSILIIVPLYRKKQKNG